jgi:hypothetical protein
MRASLEPVDPVARWGEGSDRLLSKNTSTRSMRPSTRLGQMGPATSSLEVRWRASQGDNPQCGTVGPKPAWLPAVKTGEPPLPQDCPAVEDRTETGCHTRLPVFAGNEGDDG